MAQYGRPVLDNHNSGGWSASSGTDLYAMIDEVIASDADLISRRSNSAKACAVNLTSLTDPLTATGHIVRYRCRSSGSGIIYDLIVRLRQDATTIATWTITNVPTTWSLATQTLSAAQADAITNYATLNLEFELGYAGGFGTNDLQVSWAEFELPDAAAGFVPAWAAHSNQVIP